MSSWMEEVKVTIPLQYYQSLEQSATVLMVLLEYINKCYQNAKEIDKENPVYSIIIDKQVVDSIEEGLC